MAVRQKGNKWQVDVTVDGIRAPRVSCTTRAEALRCEADFRARLMAGIPPEQLVLPTNPKVSSEGTLDALLNLTHRLKWAGNKAEETSLRNARAWVDHLGAEFKVADITSKVMIDVVDEWAANGNKGSTINRKLAGLSVLLRVAEDEGLITRRPKVPRKKEYEGRLRYYTNEEVEGLLQTASYDAQLRRLFVVAVETGMRLGELQGMIVSDIDFTNKRVNLGETKGNKRRSVPLTRRAIAALDVQVKDRKWAHDRVFDDYLNSKNIGRVIAAWKRENGIPATDPACFHTFRHTTCSRLMQRGTPLNTVMKFMGHSTIATTMRYAHLAPDSLDLAVTALERE